MSQVIADHLSIEEVAGLKETFQLMDTCKRGKVDLDDINFGLQKLGMQQVPDGDLQFLIEAVRLTHKYIHKYIHIYPIDRYFSVRVVLGVGRGGPER